MTASPTLDYAPASSRRVSFIRALLVLLPCVYLPYSWLLLIDHPWDNYRWFWLKLWPVLPGMTTTIFLPWRTQVGEIVSAGVVTFIFLLSLLLLATRRRWMLYLTAVIAFLFSCANAMFAYSIFMD